MDPEPKKITIGTLNCRISYEPFYPSGSFRIWAEGEQPHMLCRIKLNPCYLLRGRLPLSF